MIIKSDITIEIDNKCDAPTWTPQHSDCPEVYWKIAFGEDNQATCVVPFDTSWDFINITNQSSALDTLVRSNSKHVFWIPYNNTGLHTIIQNGSIVVFGIDGYTMAFPPAQRIGMLPPTLDSNDILLCARCLDLSEVNTVLFITPGCDFSKSEQYVFFKIRDAIVNTIGTDNLEKTSFLPFASLHNDFSVIGSEIINVKRYEIGFANSTDEYKEMIVSIGFTELGPVAIQFEQTPWLPIWLSSQLIRETLTELYL